MTEQTAVRSLPDLDLAWYLGLWYEIGRLPLRWEDDDAREITAQYSLEDDGTIRVDNRCFDGDGKPTQSIGKATPVEGEPAQLKVTFLPAGLRWIPFTEGDYWVLKIDESYDHALVGTPDRKNLWFLARRPVVDEATKAEFLDEARCQGFDLADWITPAQTGRHVTDADLT
ncbi:lipocalin family protein [Nocardia shimofusensis]|uniref:lipocalin family protein n=1 Tax=Nocardia shimofusensis TaxID=228596 RepID=UPI000832914F|nr:lipocalin family protein [Nocardia shimofusensis]